MDKTKGAGEKPVIVVNSVTYAMKSRELLFRHGIKAYVERLPHTRENGCGYGVYVPHGIEEAEQLLRGSGIRVLGRAERGVAL